MKKLCVTSCLGDFVVSLRIGTKEVMPDSDAAPGPYRRR
jgi:hypothetical protein